MPQMFKNGDEYELKWFQSISPFSNTVASQKRDFLANAYSCKKLGEIIYDANLSPLTNAIARNIFRDAFAEIFQAFIAQGTPETYLTVFRAVFGDDVEVTFTVPAPGKLEIDIVAAGIELVEWVGREIVDNAYVYDTIYDADDDEDIVFQGVKGFETQYELEQMLFEMVVGGIFTTISLTVGV